VTFYQRGELALQYVKRGMRVFPLAVGGVTPATRSGALAATEDETRIRQWWAQKDWNIGVGLKASGIVVLEVQGPDRATKRVQRDDFTPPEHVPDWEQISPSGLSDLFDMLLNEEAGFPQTHVVGLPDDGLAFWFDARMHRKVETVDLTSRVTLLGLGDHEYAVAPGSQVNGFTYDVDGTSWEMTQPPVWMLARALEVGG
jgi:Bifunctional DNA primase/polymerase, N-terminal